MQFAEVDSIVGHAERTWRKGLEEDTLILFSSDNGPWMIQQLSGDRSDCCTLVMLVIGTSAKVLLGKEGFASPHSPLAWQNHLPGTRSEETVSFDVLPTLARLANVTLPTDRVYDGKDMLDVCFRMTARANTNIFFSMVVLVQAV